MYIYMGHMTAENTKPYEDFFWRQNRIGLKRATVIRIDTSGRCVFTSSGEKIEFSRLVIATGSRPSKYGWPGQDLQAVQGLYSLQDLESMQRWTPTTARAVIVGGGLIGVEMAEMLHSRKIPVTFLVREKHYWDNILPREEAMLVERHMRQYGIDVRLNTQLREILPDADGRVRAVVTDHGEAIECQFVGLTAGVSPNIDVVKGSGIETRRGVLVDELLQTNVPDIYAAGDCAEFRFDRPRHPRVEQLWYTGRMQAEALAQTLCGTPTPYRRGIWFNSAKFFDIEYQTYGFVSNVPLPDESSLYWEHPDGRKAVRLVYGTASRSLIGVNVFGIRYRHEVCERWIREQRPIDDVLKRLGEANFDPEFFHAYEPSVVALYNAQNPASPVRLKARRGLWKKSA